jgi:hypothetical protein
MAAIQTYMKTVLSFLCHVHEKSVEGSVTRFFWSSQSRDKWEKAKPMYYFHMVSQTLSTCYWHDFFPNTKQSFTEPLKRLCDLSY